MSNQIVSQVFETSDYSQFKLLQGNRIVNKASLKRLKSSMGEEYLMSPILVNEHYEIIDGQHRYLAAKELLKPIRYISQAGYGLSQVQRLNSNMSNWKSIDYLHAYCELGYPEYLRFFKFMKMYPEIGFASCRLILTYRVNANLSSSSKELVTEKNSTGKYMVKSFEQGELVIPDFNLSCAFADFIMAISNYYEGFSRTAFVACMIPMYKSKKFDHKQFLHKLSFCPIKLDHRTNTSQYRELVEDIYNYRNQNKVSFKYL